MDLAVQFNNLGIWFLAVGDVDDGIKMIAAAFDVASRKDPRERTKVLTPQMYEFIRLAQTKLYGLRVLQARQQTSAMPPLFSRGRELHPRQAYDEDTITRYIAIIIYNSGLAHHCKSLTQPFVAEESFASANNLYEVAFGLLEDVLAQEKNKETPAPMPPHQHAVPWQPPLRNVCSEVTLPGCFR